jgi:hypothetical protein
MTAAPPCTVGHSAGCAKHLPNAKAGRRCILRLASGILSSFVRKIELASFNLALLFPVMRMKNPVG